MPPELVAKLKALREKGASDDQIREYARQWTTQNASGTEFKPEVMDYVRAALQGPTLGLYRPLARHVLPGGEAIAQRMSQFEKERPKTALALGLGGGLAGAGRNILYKGLGRVAEALRPISGAAGVLAPVVEGAGVGATAGAVSGAANAEPGQRAGGAVTGMLGGGLTGGVLGGAAGARLGRNPQLTRLAELARRSGGAGQLSANLAEHAVAGNADQATLADLLPSFRAEARRISNAEPVAAENIRQLAGERQAGQSARIAERLSTAMQGDPVLATRAQALETSRQSWADAAYGQLEASAPEIPESDFKAHFDTPEIRAKFRQAARYFPQPKAEGASLDSEAMASLLEQVGANPSPAVAAQIESMQGPPKTISYGQIRTYLQVLRDKAQSLGQNGMTDAARSVRSAYRELYDIADKTIPGLRDVNKEFESRMRLEEALTAGKAARNSTMANIKHEMGNFGTGRKAAMTPEEFAQYRYGLASGILEDLHKAATNRDIAHYWSNAPQQLLDKLDLVIGNKAKAEQFMRGLKSERTLARLRGAPEGSPTDANQQARTNTLLGLATGGVTALATRNPTYALLAAAAPTVLARARSAEALRMLPLLTAKGDALRAIIADIQRAGRPMQTALPGLGGGLVGASFLRNQP
jgi:hypothetical protein